MKLSFHGSTTPPNNLEQIGYWFILRQFALLVSEDDGQTRVPRINSPKILGINTIHEQYLGILEHPSGPIHCFSAEVEESTEAPPGMAFQSLRRLFGRLDETMLGLAGRAIQVVEWDRTHQYCGRCGIPVEPLPYERSKKCPNCGLTTFPRISPAVIVSVERVQDNGTELLLARNQRHPQGFFSVLAGFVEPGESLEECVFREIKEEVGIEVQNVRYFGSQPWPFPHSLMVAFTAEYASGDLQLEVAEIAEAGWYRADSLPQVPPPISIARQLIDSFVAKNMN